MKPLGISVKVACGAICAMCVTGSMAQTKVDVVNPLTVSPTMQAVGRETKFVIVFQNRSREPIENLRVYKVGSDFLIREFSHGFQIPKIPAGKRYTFTVWVRGTMGTPLPDTTKIYVDATYTQGTKRSTMILGIPLFPDRYPYNDSSRTENRWSNGS